MHSLLVAYYPPPPDFVGQCSNSSMAKAVEDTFGNWWKWPSGIYWHSRTMSVILAVGQHFCAVGRTQDSLDMLVDRQMTYKLKDIMSDVHVTHSLRQESDDWWKLQQSGGVENTEPEHQDAPVCLFLSLWWKRKIRSWWNCLPFYAF